MKPYDTLQPGRTKITVLNGYEMEYRKQDDYNQTGLQRPSLKSQIINTITTEFLKMAGKNSSA